MAKMQVGEERVLANGAVLVKGADGKVRITKGASASTMAGVRARRGSKQISAKAAMRAFSRFYKNRSYKKESGRKSAMARDMCHAKSPAMTTTGSKYRRSPRKYDYPGVDDGAKCKGKMFVSRSPSAAAKQALAAFRANNPSSGKAALAAYRASRKTGGSRKQRGAGCAWNASSLRCNKVKSAGNDEQCKVSPKGRCAKARDAPKRQASAKQLAALAKGRQTASNKRGFAALPQGFGGRRRQ